MVSLRHIVVSSLVLSACSTADAAKPEQYSLIVKTLDRDRKAISVDTLHNIRSHTARQVGGDVCFYADTAASIPDEPMYGLCTKYAPTFTWNVVPNH